MKEEVVSTILDRRVILADAVCMDEMKMHSLESRNFLKLNRSASAKYWPAERVLQIPKITTTMSLTLRQSLFILTSYSPSC